MTRFTDARGYPMRVEPPAGQGWPELDEAVATRDRVEGETRAEETALKDLEERLRTAKLARQEREAAAFVAGKKPPKPDGEVEKLAAAVDAKRQRLEVLVLANKQATEAVVQVVEEHRNRWLEESRRREQETEKAYRAAIDRLLETRLGHSRQRIVSAWLQDFPQRPTFKEPSGGGVFGLRAERGAMMMLEDVAQLLRDELESPKPRKETGGLRAPEDMRRAGVAA